MINISFEKNPDLYKDYETCLKFLRTVDEGAYEYPKDKVKFHVYTEIKTPKELMVIKSFLATQNLDHCEMIVWSDYNIEDNSLIQPYKDLVTFKVYDAEKEAIGTPLEGDLKLKMKDSKYYLQSDLARLLLLCKYGGVWADMDIIFLRDFKPLLEQEYMYMWGSETNFAVDGACATVLSLNKESELSLELLKELMVTSPRPGTTCWGKDMFANLYRRYPFPVLPSTFFNTEWCVNIKYGPGANRKMNESWFEDTGAQDNFLFTEAFTWHWHNSSHKDKPVQPGSKFDLLEKRMDKVLKEKGFC
tara:strand:+ start:203 stop:1111 length:909 start_codon:yes stop_codon:yes gene_type:complete